MLDAGKHDIMHWNRSRITCTDDMILHSLVFITNHLGGLLSTQEARVTLLRFFRA